LVNTIYWLRINKKNSDLQAPCKFTCRNGGHSVRQNLFDNFLLESEESIGKKFNFTPNQYFKFIQTNLNKKEIYSWKIAQ